MAKKHKRKSKVKKSKTRSAKKSAGRTRTLAKGKPLTHVVSITREMSNRLRTLTDSSRTRGLTDGYDPEVLRKVLAFFRALFPGSNIGLDTNVRGALSVDQWLTVLDAFNQALGVQIPAAAWLRVSTIREIAILVTRYLRRG